MDFWSDLTHLNSSGPFSTYKACHGQNRDNGQDQPCVLCSWQAQSLHNYTGWRSWATSASIYLAHYLRAKHAQANWLCSKRAGRSCQISCFSSNIATAAECKIHSTALGKLCCWSTAENIWSASARTFAETLTPGSYCVCNGDPIKRLLALASSS